MSAGALFIAVFLACTVEAVEATTIVLAAGLARGWCQGPSTFPIGGHENSPPAARGWKVRVQSSSGDG